MGANSSVVSALIALTSLILHLCPHLWPCPGALFKLVLRCPDHQVSLRPAQPPAVLALAGQALPSLDSPLWRP